jgi:HlyD family secretion protein
VLWRPAKAAPIVGIVRGTEVRVAPEVGGQLAAINVQKGARVRAGDTVAGLSALELTAAVAQARAALAAAAANRDHVYAGVRAEEVAALAAEIAKAKSRLAYAELQLGRTATLARQDIASQQSLDQAQNDAASARADVAEAEQIMPLRKPGRPGSSEPSLTRRSRPRRPRSRCSSGSWKKTILRAPADGVVSVIVAEVGENLRAGQPVLAIEEPDKRWLSFNAREDLLHGLTVGVTVDVARPGGETTDACRRHRAVAARAVRDLAGRAGGRRSRSHYAAPAPRSAARCAAFEPGMTVWISR